MPDILTITANWATGSLSNSVLSRQYDNNRYRVEFMGYPESISEDLHFYLLVLMKTDEQSPARELAPIELDSDQWVITSYFTQLVQPIRFQLCVKDESGDFEAHSPIFSGSVADSLEHDGESQDINIKGLFDKYREYVNELILLGGEAQVDDTLTISGAAADAKAVGDALAEKADADDLTAIDDRVTKLESGSGLAEDGKQALLAIARSVVYTVPNGQELYNALYNAFYPPANLVGITAVYTQSGIVTSVSSLDSLKSDLVVTALYSDGTTVNVNDYVLSGTLASGTSTITVTYSGKTANFTVSVIDALYMLPESTVFNGTNYIDTGVKLASVDRSYTITLTETNGQNDATYPVFHCMTESSPYPGLAFQKLNYNGYAVAGYSRTNVQTAINPEANNTNKVVFRHEAGSQYLYVDYATNGVRGEQLVVDNGGTFAQSDNNLLIGCYQDTSGTKGRFWKGIVSDFVILSSVIDDNAVTEYLGV